MRIVRANWVWIVAAALAGGLAFAQWRYGSVGAKEILGWAGTVASTFAGAAMAFAFNALRIRRDREEKECVAGNLAVITLVEFRDRLLQYRRAYVQPARHAPDSWFSMKSGELINIKLEIDKNSLAFLLTNHPMTWRSVVLEETRFNVIKDAVGRRNTTINEKTWPKLEAAGIGHGASIPSAEVERIIGPVTTQELKNVTAFIMETCDRNIESITACIADLRKALSQIYPDREFVRPPA